ncbi:MAG: hypothetical protein BalsKO_09890 [Balneolaceae bacterium]
MSCGFSESNEEANEVMDNFFENRIEEGSTGNTRYYSNLFLESTSTEEWERIKSLVNKANGKLVSYEQTGWKIQKKKNSSELSGTFVHYSYRIVYENGEGTETITLIKNSEIPSFKIITHHFTSTMIQQLVNKSIDEAVDSD